MTRDNLINAVVYALANASMMDIHDKRAYEKMLKRDATAAVDAVVTALVNDLESFSERGEDHGYGKRDAARHIFEQFGPDRT